MAELVESNEIMFTPFEPKMQNRFIVEVGGIPAYVIKASGRPTITFEDIPMPHMNVVRHMKGRGDWQPITMTLYDPIVPSAAQAIMEWVRLSHESVTGRDGYADFYKKELDIFSLGPVGDKVEQWTLKGAYISEANFGEMSFDNVAPTEIQVTMYYDYAILQF